MREITEDTKLEVGDKVVTRDGRSGRIICTDMKMRYRFAGDTQATDYPIVAIIETGDERREELIKYTKDGLLFPETEKLDDIFLPPKKEYLNLLRDSVTGKYRLGNGIHETPEKAVSVISVNPEFIKTIEVEV